MSYSSASDQTRGKFLREVVADLDKAFVLFMVMSCALIFLLCISMSDRRDIGRELNAANTQIAALKDELSTAKQDGARAAYRECFLHLQTVKP